MKDYDFTKIKKESLGKESKIKDAPQEDSSEDKIEFLGDFVDSDDYDFTKIKKESLGEESKIKDVPQESLSEDEIKVLKSLREQGLSVEDLIPTPKDGELMKKGENINSSGTSSPIDFLKSKKIHETIKHISKTEIKAKKNPNRGQPK